jgi:hypothetical protein
MPIPIENPPSLLAVLKLAQLRIAREKRYFETSGV